MMEAQHKRAWLDTTIKLQWILGVMGACVISGAAWMMHLSNDVRDQGKDIQGLKDAAKDMRAANRDDLQDIKQSVRELGNKFDQMKDQMIASSAGNRPEMQRWTK
jgi:hypothetical protein